MRLLKICSVICALTMFVGCTSVEEIQPTSPNDNPSTGGIEEARTRLHKILNNPSIRAAYELQESYPITALTSGTAHDAQGRLLTRANEDEALYYTFSIDDNGGYAIIGNSPELPQLIALSVGTDKISEGSQLDISLHGGGVINLPNDLNIIGGDSAIISGPGTEFDPNTRTVCDSATYNFIGPARPVPTLWGCTDPYNEYLPTNENGIHAHVGCVCIATAQILAHHGFDPIYLEGTKDEKRFNWDLIRQYTHRELEDKPGKMFNVGKTHIAPLCSLLNSPENLEMNFEWDKASYAYSEDVPYVLRKFGFTSDLWLSPYNIEKVIGELSTGMPLYIHGDGHVWIIDAVMAEKCYYTTYDRNTGDVITRYDTTRYLVHCNWGWDGKCNGYFYSGIFDTTNRPIIKGLNQDTNQPDEKGFENYSNHIRILLNVKKQ